MRVAQYVRQERAIAAGAVADIRARWFWGLRILRDPEAMTESGKSLRHGVADQLIEAAKVRGLKLSASEIRYRIQCARAYPTEAQIANAVGDFEAWRDLIAANFPAYPAPDGELPADHRTAAERERDRARDLASRGHAQEALFPLDQYEPAEAPLKDLVEYSDRQDAINDSFMATARRRRAYLDRLIEAAGGDLSVTWEAAQALLPNEVPA